MFADGACCPECVEDWLWTEQSEYDEVVSRTDLTLKCEAKVTPARVAWFFSNDAGTNWVEVNGKGLQLTIKNIQESDEGNRCLVNWTILLNTFSGVKIAHRTIPKYSNISSDMNSYTQSLTNKYIRNVKLNLDFTSMYTKNFSMIYSRNR